MIDEKCRLVQMAREWDSLLLIARRHRVEVELFAQDDMSPIAARNLDTAWEIEASVSDRCDDAWREALEHVCQCSPSV